MNKRWNTFALIIILVAVVPMALLMFASRDPQRKNDTISLQQESTEQIVVETVGTFPERNETVISLLLSSGEVVKIGLEKYVLGVVLAEMPSWFAKEAIKAQAVVARTYTLKRIHGNIKHSNASVCASASCCQGYITEKEYLKNGGDSKTLNNLKKAVEETENLVLKYNGALIEATYFSCSGGMTEDAVAVWGTEVPYLQSTESLGEEDAEHHTDYVYYNQEDLAEKLGVEIIGPISEWLGKTLYTKGGGVDQIEIAGKRFSGVEMRSRLGLRSTAFTVTAVDDTIIFTTRGYGHRVGMSQYGADAMATNGYSYEQILSHYYKGTELVLWQG